MTASAATTLTTAFFIAMAICTALILALLPLWRRKALAHPNARSSHTTPTPQGGGLAVMLTVITLMWAVAWVLPAMAIPLPARNALSAAMIALVLVGAWDDIKPLPAAPRLTIQAVAAALMLAAVPGYANIIPLLPAAMTAVILLIAAVWFINLVNFMDGLDWLTVAGLTPACFTIALMALSGDSALPVGWVAATLCGALIGFAIFNKPIARLFLGDVGSLPIGLSVAWLLYNLAASGHLAAAMLLPLYHCADATITLMRRMARRENLATAHRSHFYQRATSNGFSVKQVIANITVLNTLLAALAWLTIMTQSSGLKVLYVMAGALCVGIVLWRFHQPRHAQT